MKKNHSYILIIVTMLLVSLTISVSWFRDIESRRVEGERFLFPELGTPTDANALKMLNDITEVRIESPKETFSIIKNRESWILPDLSNFPVSVDKIKRVIVGLAQLETIEAKTKNTELHGELGLNLPSSDSSPSTSISSPWRHCDTSAITPRCCVFSFRTKLFFTEPITTVLPPIY